MDRLNKYGFSLDPSTKYSLLDEIGNHFLDRTIELVKGGSQFVYVIDNIDWEEKVHDMRKEHQNRSVHAVATSIVFDRVKSDHLPDSGPQKNLKEANFSEVVKLNEDENTLMRKRYRNLIAQLMGKYFPEFNAFKDSMPQRVTFPYEKKMCLKSNVITMPVIMKDENKYAECVVVLDTIEEWTYQIYSSAGLCYTPPANDQPQHDQAPTHEGPSRPDQPASHIPPQQMDNDPLCGVKVPCFGDQLTRVRFAGAKDLRTGSHLPKERLDHLYPFRIVDWHPKKSFLKVQ